MFVCAILLNACQTTDPSMGGNNQDDLRSHISIKHLEVVVGTSSFLVTNNSEITLPYVRRPDSMQPVAYCRIADGSPWVCSVRFAPSDSFDEREHLVPIESRGQTLFEARDQSATQVGIKFQHNGDLVIVWTDTIIARSH